MHYFWQDKHTLGLWELCHDTLFDQIPPHEHLPLIDWAWQCGKNAAMLYQRRYANLSPRQIAAERAIKITETAVCAEGVGTIFSEYYSGSKEIILYHETIRNAHSTVPEKYRLLFPDYALLMQLFIAHELYHDYECREFGLTSKKKQITTHKIWRFKIQSGIRALSEIAAHSFCRNLLNISQEV